MISNVLSLQVEPGPDSRSEFKWSLNRADYRHSSTLQDLDDSLIDPFINSLAVGSDLNSLAKESFDNIKRTSEFCTAIEDCLIRTRNNHEINQLAVKCFDEEVGLEVGTDEKKVVKTLVELKRFKAAEKPFFEKLLVLKGAICGQEESMLGKLRAQKERLDKKLKSLETWRMVLNALFVAAFGSVLVFSVMASALTAAIIPAWKWCDGCWKRNEEKVKKQKKLTTMYYAPLFSKMIIIRVHVELLEEKIHLVRIFTLSR
ncbi:hypothetical protein J1N35_006799 [Gossypium stocksii]|uniref:Uncharacterized protein n=1 Tax=Gossypium stocksii TaxID=47602 RepID=A0A9D3W5I4_9ROSI|nr:hypothetical protein J1N35_006799 [Gossypium stocksii]